MGPISTGLQDTKSVTKNSLFAFGPEHETFKSHTMRPFIMTCQDHNGASIEDDWTSTKRALASKSKNARGRGVKDIFGT